MTNKTAGKAPTAAPGIAPAHHELQAAYQLHTLAQMLYGQMAATHPWMQQPTIPAYGAVAYGPQVGPTMGPVHAPWAHDWTMAYGVPMGQMVPQLQQLPIQGAGWPFISDPFVR